jgi:hypothetical protein
MIHVELQPEPPDFDARVRQPGRSAIAELTGGPPALKRPGPRRKKIADRPEDIPPEKLPPFWTECLSALHEAYRGICAYVCIYIERVTGAGTVDHLVAKSRDVHRAYEWDNYRLACSLMNARKAAIPDVLDPFEVEDGWFQLDLISFQIRPNPVLDEPLKARIQGTIDRLGLADRECRQLRETYFTEYDKGHIDFDYLHRRAPFVALEIQRQGKLRGQAPLPTPEPSGSPTIPRS